MSDHSELKRLADAAILGGLEEGDNFRSKCRPSVIRGLFDDIARLGARLCMCRDCGGQGEVYSGHSTHQGYNQPPEPDMDVCGTCDGDGVLGQIDDFEAIAAERNLLKAEVEALRKDAERYRFVSQLAWYVDQAAYIYDIGNAKSPWAGERAPVDADDVESAIDAAMGKGAKP